MRLLTVFAVLLLSVARADPLEFESGPERVGLLELYTSEGCSSCPPADRWLSSQVGNPQVFSRFIPVAFHVDYWDYIGWKDRFARSSFSDRQRSYAREGSLNTVYTPGFVYDGAEWREFFGGDMGRRPETGLAGNLRLSVDQGRAALSFTPVTKLAPRYVINLALLGFGLKSDVQAGENRNKRLKHDFVVLSHQQTVRRAGQSRVDWTGQLPTSPIKAERYAIVAWVSGHRSQQPLQAAGGFLPLQAALLE